MPVRRATPDDLGLILSAGHLFDGPPTRDRTTEMLADPRHHLFLALVQDRPVGFLSAVDYVHPDKPRQMWINELGVAQADRRQGHASALTTAATTHAQTLDCSEIWVLADNTAAALGFYTSLGWVRAGDHIAMFTKVLT
ncbi:MAG: GNAT family N-acetyltransferase [Pseudomonadota bacterium]